MTKVNSLSDLSKLFEEEKKDKYCQKEDIKKTDETPVKYEKKHDWYGKKKQQNLK